MSGRRPFFYDQHGEPLTAIEFGVLWELGIDYRRVAHEMVGGVEVSTVWLGIDLGFGASGPPLIFETMVFEEDAAVFGRYATHAEAEHGHRLAVAAVRAAIASQS